MQRPQIGESGKHLTHLSSSSSCFSFFFLRRPERHNIAIVFPRLDMFERVFSSPLPFSPVITTFDGWRKLVHWKCVFFTFVGKCKVVRSFFVCSFGRETFGRENGTVEENLAKASWTVIYLRIIFVKDCHLRSTKKEPWMETQGKLDFPNTFVRIFFWMPSPSAEVEKIWTDFSEKSNAKKPKGAN